MIPVQLFFLFVFCTLHLLHRNAPPPVHHGSPVQYVHNPETGASKATTGGRVKLGQNFAQPPEEPNVYEVSVHVLY